MQKRNPDDDTVKILVVDDEECAVEELVFALRSAGFSVVGTTNASQGLEHFLKDVRIGVVISDIRMPMQDGISFLQNVRQCGERGAACALILMTGFPEISSAIDAINLRVARYLQKPFEPDEALAAAAAAVSNYRQAVESSDIRSAAVSTLRALLSAPAGGDVEPGVGKSIAALEEPENREKRRTQTLKSLLRFRSERSALLPQDMFGDPAWFMLLELALMERGGKKTSISGLAMSGYTSQATAMRRIQEMLDVGLIERHEDPSDKRRFYINLTNEARDRLNLLLDRSPYV